MIFALLDSKHKNKNEFRNRFTFYDQVHTTGMDIKQCLNAKALVTLGKDMTWRDYAQGAFRMRGLGIGQKICLIVIPEVDKLVSKRGEELVERSASEGVGGGDLLNMTTGTTGEAFLVNVAAWLVVNGMRSENMQFNILSEQSVRNVWRKRAFKTLAVGHGELTRAAFGVRSKRTGSVAENSDEELKRIMGGGGGGGGR